MLARVDRAGVDDAKFAVGGKNGGRRQRAEIIRIKAIFDHMHLLFKARLHFGCERGARRRDRVRGAHQLFFQETFDHSKRKEAGIDVIIAPVVAVVSDPAARKAFALQFLPKNMDGVRPGGRHNEIPLFLWHSLKSGSYPKVGKIGHAAGVKNSTLVAQVVIEAKQPSFK